MIVLAHNDKIYLIDSNIYWQVENMSNEERIDLLLVDHLPSDDEFDSIADADASTEVSPGSKENDPKAAKSPSASQPKKRRRILTLDSDDDSGDDATFEPSKAVSSLINMDIIFVPIS